MRRPEPDLIDPQNTHHRAVRLSVVAFAHEGIHNKRTRSGPPNRRTHARSTSISVSVHVLRSSAVAFGQRSSAAKMNAAAPCPGPPAVKARIVVASASAAAKDFPAPTSVQPVEHRRPDSFPTPS